MQKEKESLVLLGRKRESIVKVEKGNKVVFFGEIAESFKGGSSLYASSFSLSLVSLCIRGLKFSSMKKML